ncbi:hypothetical protein Q7P35_002223 [Cladosporium inversicolor]
MALGAGPSISLAVSSTTKKNPTTSLGSAAFSLAAKFNRELIRSKSDADKAKVCRTYRDTIMRVSMWADDIAAAFTDAFAPFSQKPQRGRDTEAWKSFASLAQRSQQTRTHDAQKIRHQTAVVAIWGADIFEHYGWHELSLDNTRLLRSVACKQRDWKLAVRLINSVMLERHETRVVKHDNRLPLIGEHPHGSKIQDCRSPVQRRDIIAVIDRLQENNDEVNREEQRMSRDNTIAGTQIRDYGLETDRYGMVVPHGRPGVTRDISSPSHRASKRRKLGHLAVEDPRGSTNSSTAPDSPQLSSTSASTPVSELTQFEEESRDHTISGGLDSHSPTSLINRNPAGGANPVENLTSNTPPIDNTADDLSRDASCGASFLTRCRSMSTSRRAFTDHDVRVSKDTGSGTDPIADQSYGTTEGRVGERQGDGQVFMADSRFTRSSSAESSYKQSCHDSSSAIVEVSRSGHNTMEQLDKCHSSSSNDHEVILPDATEILPEVLSTDSERHIGNACEEGHPASSRHDVDTDRSKDGGSKEDYQIEDGSDIEFCTSGHIAALEEAGRIDISFGPPLLEIQPENAQDVQHALPQQQDEGVEPNVEASSVPILSGRFIPSPGETPIHQYCTDTNVIYNSTMASRMASSHSRRLRNLLDLARRSSGDSETEKHSKLKVAWLERTRWADTYEVPEAFDLTTPLPLDADVWYMAWETFQQRAHAGEIFGKPIVIKQKFQDSDMYEPRGYMSALKEKFAFQKLDVQNSETGECRKMDVKDFCAARSDTTNVDEQMLAATSNAINLRKIANADAPLLTRVNRFRLLETLTERAANIGPGKRISRQVNDVSDCLGFDLLGFEGAFTRPHVDALVGTWVRCLSGEKAWIFAPGMDAKDWNDFARDGQNWCPAGKGRVIILEKDDVLLMPPGVRILHTVFTLGPSLMEGGMLWDECNIPALLDELLWVAQNQPCTNEAIAYQLPSIIDMLEVWVEEHGERLSALGGDTNCVETIKLGIGKLRDLGCQCTSACRKNPDCLCSIHERRCTAWCAKHPTLPEQAKSQAHQCMYDA